MLSIWFVGVVGDLDERHDHVGGVAVRVVLRRTRRLRPPAHGWLETGSTTAGLTSLDRPTPGEVSQHLAAAEVRAGIACLDLSQVRFFAAAGVRMIFAAHTAATSPDGGIRVVCSTDVMQTLQLCRLTGTNGLHVTATPETRNGGG